MIGIFIDLRPLVFAVTILDRQQMEPKSLPQYYQVCSLELLYIYPALLTGHRPRNTGGAFADFNRIALDPNRSIHARARLGCFLNDSVNAVMAAPSRFRVPVLHE